MYAIRSYYVVPPGDDARLSAGIGFLLREDEARSQLGANGRARVAASFTRTHMLDRIEAVYREVRAAAG